MPFTPAHPALVLPLINRKYFSATALIIGSISPDFEYFFKASVNGVHGHTILGLFYFDLPVTIFFSIVFHLLVKENLIGNLPVFLQRRLMAMRQLDFKKKISKEYRTIIFSSLLGALSHIFWDGFTHNGSFFVDYFEVYRHVVVPFQGVKYPLFYGLQHISTYTGISAIAIYIYFMPMEASSPVSCPRISYWLFLLLFGFVFFTLRFAFMPQDFNLGNAVVTGISSLIFSLCVLGSIKWFTPTN